MRVVTLLCALIMMLSTSTAWAAVPEHMSYSGELLEGDTPFEGDVELVFEIYNAVEDGELVWSESHADVSVSDGHFDVALGVGSDDLSAALVDGPISRSLSTASPCCRVWH